MDELIRVIAVVSPIVVAVVTGFRYKPLAERRIVRYSAMYQSLPPGSQAAMGALLEVEVSDFTARRNGRLRGQRSRVALVRLGAFLLVAVVSVVVIAMWDSLATNTLGLAAMTYLAVAFVVLAINQLIEGLYSSVPLSSTDARETGSRS